MVVLSANLVFNARVARRRSENPGRTANFLFPWGRSVKACYLMQSRRSFVSTRNCANNALGLALALTWQRPKTCDMLRPIRYSNLFVSEHRLIALIERTARFLEAIHAHLGNLVPAEGTRHLVAFQAALLSLEHATGASVLIGQGFFPSAYVVIRPQYECLVRGIWLLYAASDA